MQAKTVSIADMHVVVDNVGERVATIVAADLARRFQAHLTGLALAFEPLIPVYPMAAPIPTEAIVASREAAAAQAKAAAAAFEKVAARVGVPFETQRIETIAGEGFADLIDACRLSDLAVVGQENPDRREPFRRDLIQALLFDAGAPTLLVPYAGVMELDATRAVVAWDGSVQASRALRGALPLLLLAKDVTVAIVAEEAKWAGGAPGADIADHLARHGLAVDVKRLDNPTGDVAATLLNAVADGDAGLLVMGAYAHNRIREFVLGGTTRSILESATVPVLLAH